MKKSYIFFVIIYLTACGGGSSDLTPEPTPAPSPPAPTSVPPVTPTPASKIDVENSWAGEFQFNFNDTTSFAINSLINSQQTEEGFYIDNENGNNTNLSAYTATGNEDLDAIISAEEIFIADLAYNSEIDSYFLITDPDIQARLTGNSVSWGAEDSEGCSVIKVVSPSYQYECFFPYSSGRVEPKLKRLATSLDFSRRTLDFNPDGFSIFNAYLANYDRDFPQDVSGGTNDSVTLFNNGSETFIATPDGYRNEGAVWMNNIIFVTFDGPWYLNNGELYQNLPYKYHFWDVSDDTPVLTHALECSSAPSSASYCGGDFFGIMVEANNKVYTKGRIFSQTNSGTINITDTAIKIPIKGSDNKLWAVVNESGYLESNEESTLIEIQEVVNDAINVSGAIKGVVNDGNLPIDVRLKRSSGIAPIQYSVVNLTDQYIMYVKALPPVEPTSSIEGISFPLNTSIDLGGGYKLEQDNNNDILVITIPENLPSTEDLTIDYMVNNDTTNKSFTITFETISNFRNSEYFGNAAEGLLIWPTPEPHREGICIIDFINNNEKCVSFDEYMVLSMDLEHISFGQRFDGNEAYPNPNHAYNLLGHNPPGVHSIQLIENELLIYFKNSNQDKTGGNLYKASGDISNFMQDGLATFTVTQSTNTESDFELVMSLIQVE